MGYCEVDESTMDVAVNGVEKFEVSEVMFVMKAL